MECGLGSLWLLSNRRVLLIINLLSVAGRSIFGS